MRFSLAKRILPGLAALVLAALLTLAFRPGEAARLMPGVQKSLHWLQRVQTDTRMLLLRLAGGLNSISGSDAYISTAASADAAILRWIGQEVPNVQRPVPMVSTYTCTGVFGAMCRKSLQCQGYEAAAHHDEELHIASNIALTTIALLHVQQKPPCKDLAQSVHMSGMAHQQPFGATQQPHVYNSSCCCADLQH